MINKILFLLVIVLPTFSFAQDYKVVKDEITGEPLILGFCPLSEMNDSVFVDNWTFEYDDYKPDYKVIDKLEGKLDGVEITIVFRSTCSDSREQIPRFFKVLNELGYDMNSLTLIGVNRKMKGLSNETEGLDIERVPTFIFYKNGKEIGGIIETPEESLEKDLLQIVLK